MKRINPLPVFLSLTMLAAVTACSNNSHENEAKADEPEIEQKTITADTNVIKVYVDKAGKITANGNSISLKDLDSAFSKLKAGNGTVYYARANGQGEPPPQSMEVMGLVIKHEVPIRLYTDKTFTVIVEPN